MDERRRLRRSCLSCVVGIAVVAAGIIAVVMFVVTSGDGSTEAHYTPHTVEDDPKPISAMIPEVDPIYSSGFFQGDIRMTTEEITKDYGVHAATEAALNGEIVIDNSSRRLGAASFGPKKWPNNVIYYQFERGYPTESAETVRNALLDFKALTNIYPEEAVGNGDYVLIMDDGGCSSALGMQGGAQKMSLASACMQRGIILHEFMHALGFSHEHTAPDRDSFITVNLENVEDKRGHNFERIQGSVVSNQYDYYSIMHYSEWAFSKNGRKTIDCRGNPCGQRFGFSQSDVDDILALYSHSFVGRPTCIPLGNFEFIQCLVRRKDGSLWHKKIRKAWTSLGGELTSDPECLTYGHQRQCFGRGKYGGLWQIWSDTHTSDWSSWMYHGGFFPKQRPRCLVVGSHLRCFVRGMDNALWLREWSGVSWRGWKSLGGVLTGDPECFTHGQQTHCFCRGTDTGLWQIWAESPTADWSGWIGHGGHFAKQRPSCVSTESLVRCFVRGTDDALWLREWSGVSWRAWKSLGGVLSSSPECISHGSLTHCFCRGTDGGLWQIWSQSPAAEWSHWIGLGGRFPNQQPVCIFRGHNPWCFVRGNDQTLFVRRWLHTDWLNWYRFF